jgi:hypothetical protein
MKPIGLTMKNGRNKYRLDRRGELMLVHQCECGSLSMNRIAADDDSSSIMAVFQSSLEARIHSECESHGIALLTTHDRDVLYKQLYGGRTEWTLTYG